MFCGLPISVSAEPTLALQASASRKGTGLSRRARHTSISTGAIARQMMSLLNTADRPATITINAPSSCAGGSGRLPVLCVTQV